jgi:FkbM family methyltransferase
MLSQSEDPTIVDAGANEGRTVELFTKSFSDPTIHAFEPIPSLAQELRDHSSDHDIHVHQKALGDERSEELFRVNENKATSSLRDPTEYNREQHGDAVAADDEIPVTQVRLDETVQDVDILKLDLQGHELTALRGAEDLFPDIDIIMTEVMFIKEYESQPLFGDIDTFLRDHGYQLFNLYELSTHENGRLDQADALYARQSLLPDGDTG